jgi:hypothetical protein
LAAVILVLAWGTVSAEISPQDLQRLGKDLTPMGSEKAGNKDGSIPAWEGGLTKPPANFDRTKGYANPFANEKPLYVITGANIEQYKDLLPAGQIEMLKRYPTYKMKVYPTHRTVGLPQWVYDATKAEAPNIKLVPGGFGVTGLKKSGAPFPVPKNGMEVMENHIFAYRYEFVVEEFALMAVQKSGSFTPIRWLYDSPFARTMEDSEPNRHWFLFQRTLSPSNVAGEAIVVVDSIDQTRDKDRRQAWQYNPGQRRVLRAPYLSHDFPLINSDGLATTDDMEMFNGSLDRYDWKLLGKKEMIISYNNYDLTSKALKYKDIVKPIHLNQDIPRYEKHRVWIVEATLKPGMRHVYARRVFYIDEDSWRIVHADSYDGRGGLWRVAEGHSTQFYDNPGPYWVSQVIYDLQAQRYFVAFLTNEEKPAIWNLKKPRSYYTVDNLRRSSN